MRTMRRLMMTQKGQWINEKHWCVWKGNSKICCSFFLVCIDKEKQAASVGQPGFGSRPTAHCRPRKRRSAYRVTQHLLSSTRRASLETLDAPLLRALPTESGEKKEEQESPTPSSELNSSRTSVPPPQHQPINLNNTPNSHLNHNQLLEVLYDLFGLWLKSMKYQHTCI